MASRRLIASKRSSSKLIRRAALLGAAVAGMGLWTGAAQGSWNGALTGTTNDASHSYTRTASPPWSGAAVEDTWSGTLTGATTIYFGGNYTTGGAWTLNPAGNFALTLQGGGTVDPATGGTIAAANRTVTLGGNLVVDHLGTSNNTVVIGSATANNNLTLDLNGTARSLSVATGDLLQIVNNVISTGGNAALTIDGGGTTEFTTAATQTQAVSGTTVQSGSTLKITGAFVTGNYSFGAAASTITLTGNGRFQIGTSTAAAPLTVQNAWNIGAGGGRIETYHHSANPNENWNFAGATTLGGDLALKIGYGGTGSSTWSGNMTVTGADRNLSIDTTGNAALATFSGALLQDVAGRTLTLRAGTTDTAQVRQVTTLSGNNTIDNIIIDTSALTSTNAIRFGNIGSLPDTSLKIASGAFAGIGFTTAADVTTALSRISADSTGVLGIDAAFTNNIDLSAAGLNRDLRIGSSGTITYTGTITPNGSTYKLGGGGGTLTLGNANAITGTNALDVSTQGNLIAGTVALTNTNNFAGNISVGAGMTLQISSSGSLGAETNAITNLAGTLAPTTGGSVTTTRSITGSNGATLSGGAATSSLTINTPTANFSLGNTTLASTGGILTLNTALEAADGTLTISNTGTNVVRLGGNNSAYNKNIALGANALTLMAANSMIAGNIDGSTSGAATTRLFLNGAGSPGTYTFGIGNGAGEISGPDISQAFTGDGFVAFGGDVTWDPGNGGNYTVGATATLKNRINIGTRIASDYSRILFGSNTGNLVLNNTFTIRARQNAANVNQLVMQFALSDDGTARQLTIDATHVVLTRASAGTANSTIVVGVTGATSADGSLAISNTNQLPAGNLNLINGVLIVDNIGWSTLVGARALGGGAGQMQMSGTDLGAGFAARTASLVISTTGTTSSTFDRSFTLGSVARDGSGNYYADQPVELSLSTTMTAARTLTTNGPSTQTHLISGGLNLNGAAVILTKAGSAGLSITGQVTGTGGITATAGTLELTNATNNFSGLTTINGATLNVNTASALSNGGLTLTTGTINMNAAGMTGGTLAINGGTFNDNSASVGNTALNIGGGTIVAKTSARTLSGGGTITADFTMGTASDQALTLSGNFTLSGTRTITLPNTGPGLGGASGSGVIQQISGNLSGTGALFIKSSTGGLTAITSPIGEIILSGANSWTGSPNSGQVNTNNFFSAGTGGLMIAGGGTQSGAVDFASPSALPTGNASTTTPSYLAAMSRNGTGMQGYILSGNATAYSLNSNGAGVGAGAAGPTGAYRFVIGGVGANELPGFIGSDNGAVTLQNTDIAIHNATALEMVVRDAGGTFTLGSVGNPVRYLATSGADATALTPATTLTNPAANTKTINKYGPGELVLSNVVYKQVDDSTASLSTFNWVVLNGTLTAGGASAFHTLGNVTVGGTASTDATFNIRSGVTVDRNVTTSGTGGNLTIATKSTSGVGTLTGTLTLGKASILSAAGGGELDINTVISGNFGLTVTGGGSVVYGGTARTANTDTAATTVLGATTLVLNTSNAGVSVNAIAGNVTLGDGTTLNAGTVQLNRADQIVDTADVTITANSTLNLNNFNETITSIGGAGGVTVGTSATLTLSGTNASTYTGTLSAGASAAINKTGSAVWTLGGTQTYAAPTTVTGGILRLSSAGAVSPNTNLTINNTSLELAGGNVTLAGVGTGAGQIQILGAQPAFGALGADQTIDLGLPAGTSVVWGSTYFNPSTALQLGTATSDHKIILASNIALDSGTAATRIITSIHGSAPGADGEVSGVISSTSGSVLKINTGVNNTGWVKLSGANTYNGQTWVNQGTLEVSSIGNWAAGNSTPTNLGSPTTSANGKIVLGHGGGSNTNPGTLRYVGAGETTNRTISLGGGAGDNGGIRGIVDSSGAGPLVVPIVFGTSGTGGSCFLTLTGTNAGDNTASAAYSDGTGSTVGTSTITKAGTGTWVLSNAGSAYSGGTVISNGLLVVQGNEGASGSFTGTVTNGSATISGVTDFTNVHSGDVVFGVFTSGTSSTINSFNVGAGTITLNNNANVTTGSYTLEDSTASGILGRSHGQLVLGDTGTTNNNGSPSLLIDGAYTIAHPITIANQATTGTYTLGGRSTSATATFSGSISLNKSITLSQAAGGTVLFSGVIADASGANAVTASGPGTVVLSNANTYAGGTTVSGGTLRVTNGTTGSATGPGSVRVNAGSTLSGTGSISGAVSVAGGTSSTTYGAINLTDGSIGTLHLGSTLALGDTASNYSPLTFEFNTTGTPTPTTSFDQIAVTGALTLNAGGARVSLTNLAGAPVSGQYNIMTFASGGDNTRFAWSDGTTTPKTVGSISYALGGNGTSEWIVIAAGGDGEWTNGSADGLWTTAGNWDPSIPGSAGQTATFGPRGHGGTVHLAGDKTVGALVFNAVTLPDPDYTISGDAVVSPAIAAGALTIQGSSAAITVHGGSPTITAPTVIASNASINIDSGAKLTMGALTVTHGVTATLNSGGRALVLTAVPVLQGLTGPGKLDLQGNALVVPHGDTTAVGSFSSFTSAYDGLSGLIQAKTLVGSGGDGNHGLAVMTAAQALANGHQPDTAGGSSFTFHAETVSGTDVLVQYGYNGDLNMSGGIDYLDYGVIDNSYLWNQNPANAGSERSGYAAGDINLDGVINYLDYGMMDNACLAQTAPHNSTAAATAAMSSSAVPEPAALGLLGIGAFGLLARRRARRS